MVLSNKEWLDKMDEIISAIQNGGVDSQVIEDMLSNMWISSDTYNVGDYVLYNNNIWKCLVQNSNITPSEGTTWTRVNITSEISILNSNLNGLFKTYYGVFNVEGEDFSITPPNFEGYTLISVSLAGSNMIMTDISYVIRQDIGNKIEVQTISSYVGKKLVGYLVYIKSDFIN